jgi:hypothetical protein
MIRVALAALAALAVQDPRPAPAAGESVARVYDLARIAPRGQPGELAQVLLPALLEPFDWDFNEPYFDVPSGDVEFALRILRSMFPQEFQYENRSVWSGPEGRLLVRGPASFHERIQRVLGAIEQASAGTELAFDLVDLSDPSVGAAPGGGTVVALAELEPWLARAAQAGRTRSWRMRVRPGEPAILDLSREVPLVVDYDVEIAHQSFIHDPVVRIAAPGTRVELRASSSGDGIFLALSLRRSEALGEVRERRLEQAGLIVTEQGPQSRPSRDIFQSLEMGHGSLALNMLLPEGKALLVRSELLLSRSQKSEVLVIRRSGPPMDGVRTLQLEGDGPQLALVNVEALEPPRCRPSQPLADSGYLPRALDIRLRSAVFGAALLPGKLQAGELWSLGGRGGERFESWPWTALVLPAAQRGGALAPEELRSAWPAERRTAEVALSLTRGRTVVARLALPLRAGVGSAAILGVESTLAFDFDVEVAQAAAADDPEIAVAFDGLLVWLTPTFSQAGDLALEVAALVHLQDGSVHPFATQGDLSKALTLEQARFAHLFASERLLFPAGGGPGRAILGDSGSGPDAIALAVEVRF